MDLVRELLLEIEGGKRVFQFIDPEVAEAMGVDVVNPLSREEVTKREYHLHLLQEAKFVALSQTAGGYYHIQHITWAGHDFLDTVRDSELWRRTKAGAAKIGGFSLDLLLELGKGYAKEKARELGFPIT